MSWTLRVGTAAALAIDAAVHHETTWQVPGKLLSAYAEGAAVVLAGLGLTAAELARRSGPADRGLGVQRRPRPGGAHD